MLKRPLLLKLIALYLCLDPVFRIFLISLETQFSMTDVFFKTLSLSAIDIFNFWFLFPISGLLLLGTNTIFFMLFIVSQIYSFYHHINYESYSWPYLLKSPSLTSYFLLGIDLVIIIYFLLPSNRKVFTDKKMRWWERGSRFLTNIKCSWGKELECKGRIVDIAFGGCLLETTEELDANTQLNLHFTLLGDSLNLVGNVVRISGKKNEIYRYGIQFVFQNIIAKFFFRVRMFFLMTNKGFIKYR